MEIPETRGKPQVNLLNLDSMPPIKQGVNTPRSCGICAQQGVNPKELMPKTVEDFIKEGVSENNAKSRFRRYEQRRQTLLKQLRPIRESRENAPPPLPTSPKKNERTSPERNSRNSVPRSSQSPPRSPNRFTGTSPHRKSTTAPQTEEERVREEEERLERECEEETARIARWQAELQREQRRAEILRQRYAQRQERKVAHFYQRKARETRVIQNLRAFDADPEISPLRKSKRSSMPNSSGDFQE